jgi:hypothetical protein
VSPAESVGRILVRAVNWLGDPVLALPALNRRFPEGGAPWLALNLGSILRDVIEVEDVLGAAEASWS